jgi:hypothetical protein
MDRCRVALDICRPQASEMGLVANEAVQTDLSGRSSPTA